MSLDGNGSLSKRLLGESGMSEFHWDGNSESRDGAAQTQIAGARFTGFSAGLMTREQTSAQALQLRGVSGAGGWVSSLSERQSEQHGVLAAQTVEVVSSCSQHSTNTPALQRIGGPATRNIINKLVNTLAMHCFQHDDRQLL